MKKTAGTIKTLVPSGPSKFKAITLKLSPEEYETLKKKATKFARGNVTGYLRYLTMHVEPRPEDLV